MRKSILVIAALLAASSAWATLVTDDFNRADTGNDRSGDPNIVGANWRNGDLGNSYWAIGGNEVDAMAANWDEVLYNDALQTGNSGGDSFTVSLDIKGNANAVWVGGVAFNVQDGANWYGLRFKTGSPYIQFARTFSGSTGVSTVYNGSHTFLADTYYTMTVSSDTPGIYDIDVREKGSATSIWSGTRDDTANGALSGGYGGLYVTQAGLASPLQSFDNYSLDAIPEPATFGLLGLAGAAVLFARRYFI